MQGVKDVLPKAKVAPSVKSVASNSDDAGLVYLAFQHFYTSRFVLSSLTGCLVADYTHCWWSARCPKNRTVKECHGVCGPAAQCCTSRGSSTPAPTVWGYPLHLLHRPHLVTCLSWKLSVVTQDPRPPASLPVPTNWLCFILAIMWKFSV